MKTPVHSDIELGPEKETLPEIPKTRMKLDSVSLRYSEVEDSRSEVEKIAPSLTQSTNLEIVLFVLNMVKNAIGTSILLIPWTMTKTGIMFSLIILSLAGIMCVYTFLLIADGARLTEQSSYSGIFQELFGKQAAKAVDVCILFENIVILTFFVILAADTLPAPLQHWFGLELNRSVLILIICAFLLPISALRNLSSVRHISLIGIGFLMFIVGGGIYLLGSHRANDVSVFLPNMGIWVAFPILGGVFDIHINAPRFFQEFKPLSEAQSKVSFRQVVGGSFFLVFLICFGFGVVGYLTFGSTVESNILLSYKEVSKGLTAVMNLGAAVSVMISFALFFNALRCSVDKLMFEDREPCVRRRLVETLVLVAIAMGMAMLIRDLGGFVGVSWGVLGTINVFILPCVIGWRLNLFPTLFSKVFAGLILVYAFCISMGLGVTFSMIGWVETINAANAATLAAEAAVNTAA